MVDIMGHVAMGLLWAIPAWFVWTKRTSLVFIGMVAVFALLPDIDLWLERLAPSVVHHHGVTHTVVFIAAISVIVGVIAAAVLTRPLDRWLGYERFDAGSMFAFTTGAVLLGGLSHLFADMLSAPDIATPIEPFWPIVNKPWSLDVIYYNSPWWNIGLLTVAVLLHIAIAYTVDPREHSYRIRGA